MPLTPGLEQRPGASSSRPEAPIGGVAPAAETPRSASAGGRPLPGPPSPSGPATEKSNLSQPQRTVGLEQQLSAEHGKQSPQQQQQPAQQLPPQQLSPQQLSPQQLPPQQQSGDQEVITVDLPDLSRLPEQPRSLGGGKHLFQFGNTFMIEKKESQPIKTEEKKKKEDNAGRSEEKRVELGEKQKEEAKKKVEEENNKSKKQQQEEEDGKKKEGFTVTRVESSRSLGNLSSSQSSHVEQDATVLPPTVGSPDTNRPPTIGSPDATRPPTVGSPDTIRPPSVGSPDTTRSPTVGSPDTTRSPTVSSPDTTRSPTVGSPDTTRSPSVGSPDTTRPPTVGSSDTTRSPSGVSADTARPAGGGLETATAASSTTATSSLVPIGMVIHQLHNTLPQVS